MQEIDEKLLTILEKLEKRLAQFEGHAQNTNSGALTYDELSARWRVGVRKLTEMKNAGKIPFIMIDGAVRFPVTAIEQYETRNTIKVSGL